MARLSYIFQNSLSCVSLARLNCKRESLRGRNETAAILRQQPFCSSHTLSLNLLAHFVGVGVVVKPTIVPPSPRTFFSFSDFRCVISTMGTVFSHRTLISSSQRQRGLTWVSILLGLHFILVGSCLSLFSTLYLSSLPKYISEDFKLKH